MGKPKPERRGKARRKTDPGLQAALDAVAGNKSELARRLGVTHQAVQQWTVIPLRNLLEVERVTGVPRKILRPDLYA